MARKRDLFVRKFDLTTPELQDYVAFCFDNAAAEGTSNLMKIRERLTALVVKQDGKSQRVHIEIKPTIDDLTVGVYLYLNASVADEFERAHRAAVSQ